MQGLNTTFVEKILAEYFGIKNPDKSKRNVRVGLGFVLQGATHNLYDFDEVSTDDKNDLNYKRARIAFSPASEGMMINTSSVIFTTASKDWTIDRKIQYVGIFDTDKYYDEKGNLIQPNVILALPNPVEVKAGETVIFDPSTIGLNLSDE